MVSASRPARSVVYWRTATVVTREEKAVGKTEYLQGALDLLILQTLTLRSEPRLSIQQRVSRTKV